MKLSQVLGRQHIDFMFKKHWRVQGKRTPIDNKVENKLKELNIPVVDAIEFVKTKPEEHPKVDIVGPFEVPAPLNKNHPDYKRRPCFTLKESNVLLEGISQVQVITKTIIAENKLPSKIEELAEISVPKSVHEHVKKAILSANVFDCEQKKLPKIKDPNRPAYNFPRILGITDARRNLILSNRLLQLVEKISDLDVSTSKHVVNDVNSIATFIKDQDLIQFRETSQILVTTDKQLRHDVSDSNISFKSLPDLYPIKHTITLEPEHFYNNESTYPIKSNIVKRHPHTTWLHYNKTQVGNIYEEPVTYEQQLGRSLSNSFAVAVTYARQQYGEEIKELPEPIYVNSIQTDGQNFHFGVFELNTLNFDGIDGTMNKWYCKNNLCLYESSRYFSGMPVLEKYNPQVFGYINAMYNS